jgi:hypothetical protein
VLIRFFAEFFAAFFACFSPVFCGLLTVFFTPAFVPQAGQTYFDPVREDVCRILSPDPAPADRMSVYNSVQNDCKNRRKSQDSLKSSCYNVF